MKSGVGGRHRASLCVTMDGYTRRGKAGSKSRTKDLGGMVARCVTYAAWRCLFRCRVRVTGVRLGSGQIVHEQRRVQREKEENATFSSSDKELGTGESGNVSGLKFGLQTKAYWIRLEACTSISSILKEFSSSLIL